MYLVYDVGGTFLKFGILDTNGKVIVKDKVPSSNEVHEEFMASVRKAYDMYKDQYEIEGIAMSIPGLVDVANGVLLGSGALKCMYNHCITKEISELLDGKKVAIENDGRSAGLAEAWIGAAKDVQNACVLAFGTGIAGAVIIDKHVLHGTHLLAGEASYLPWRDLKFKDQENEDHHDLGFFGLDYSAIGIVRKAAGVKHDKTMTGEKLFELYLNGDEEITAIMEDFFYHVAIQCYTLQYIVDPDVICIGGGISAQPSLVAGIQKYIHIIKTQNYEAREPAVVRCEFMNDSNLIGALYNYKQIYEGA